MNVLFICTGNSARSLMAEAVLNARGGGRHKAFSAGSRPTGEPNPLAIRTLEAAGYDASGLRSKNWDEFSGAGAVAADLVITLCDSAAAEECPIWTGSPRTEHWGLPDPAAVADPHECERAFARTLAAIETRIDAMMTSGER